MFIECHVLPKKEHSAEVGKYVSEEQKSGLAEIPIWTGKTDGSSQFASEKQTESKSESNLIVSEQDSNQNSVKSLIITSETKTEAHNGKILVRSASDVIGGEKHLKRSKKGRNIAGLLPNIMSVEETINSSNYSLSHFTILFKRFILMQLFPVSESPKNYDQPQKRPQTRIRRPARHISRISRNTNFDPLSLHKDTFT